MAEKCDEYQLYEVKPAEHFHDAHLLGNGSLGASVFGGVPYEEVLINHDTLWSGQERKKVNPDTKTYFSQAREMAMTGQIKEANRLINDRMLGLWTESYLPLGSLRITYGLTSDLRSFPQRRRLLSEEQSFKNYKRILSVSTAVEHICYTVGSTTYTREYFVSKPDNLLAIRLTAEGGTLDVALALDSLLRHEQLVRPHSVVIKGRAPDRVESYVPHYEPRIVYRRDDASAAVRFACAAKVAACDGQVDCDDFRLYITGATEAIILLTARTDYAGYQKPRHGDADRLAVQCEVDLEKSEHDYQTLLDRHLQDYHRLYNRLSVGLGQTITGSLPTSERLKRADSVDDPTLGALVLQYARYLLIAFSRPGTQAGNLQGIWNPSVTPSWASNYTTNINVQMNYWAAESLGLSECHQPLMELIDDLARSGQAAARDLYGMNGWVTHHNTDIWRMAAVSGEDAAWAWWPFGGIWLCSHLWQHYEYTGDRIFLRDTVYPVLQGAVAFLLDFVVKGEDGYYYTAPSTSPENKFFWRPGLDSGALSQITSENRFDSGRDDVCTVCRASTMDIALIREIFSNLEKTAALLDGENPLAVPMKDVLEHLPPFQTGRHGQLQEWDQDFEECTPGMGHVSHLYTVYPSNVISQDNPELFRAAQVALARRHQHGGGFSHWPGAWALCLHARFGDQVQCGALQRSLPIGLGANMLTADSYQIDAVMGWAAGIKEMLVQTDNHNIRLLPALPLSWRNGFINGLRTPGGLALDLEWADGTLVKTVLKAERPWAGHVAWGDIQIAIELDGGTVYELDVCRFREPKQKY